MAADLARLRHGAPSRCSAMGAPSRSRGNGTSGRARRAASTCPLRASAKLLRWPLNPKRCCWLQRATNIRQPSRLVWQFCAPGAAPTWWLALPGAAGVESSGERPAGLARLDVGAQTMDQRKDGRARPGAVVLDAERSDSTEDGADRLSAPRAAKGRGDGVNSFVGMHAGSPCTCGASTNGAACPTRARYTVAEPLTVCRPSPLHASTVRRNQTSLFLTSNSFPETRCPAGPQVVTG